MQASYYVLCTSVKYWQVVYSAEYVDSGFGRRVLALLGPVIGVFLSNLGVYCLEFLSTALRVVVARYGSAFI